MTYLSRDQLLRNLTTLAERDLDVPALVGTVHLIELTGKQRQEASRAARLGTDADGNDEFDNNLFRAVIVQMGVVDPETKQPVFSPADVEALRDGRHEAINTVATAILELSEMLPVHLKSGDPTPDAGQPAA